ncbi:unnamed protein product [Lactuca saligna]|uniref:Uncharacterized protein n=1 Tax=Lactuca saligna TaxID=75948 RepID=A0AA36A3K1_LACSI|nr:unnamed protein product [Lactuca saligna]
MAPQMSLSLSDGALKIVDADEESGFTFFGSSFIETGFSIEELRWKFYEKSAAVGPPLSVEISNSPPLAIVGPHPHSDRWSSPLIADQVFFFGKDSPEIVKQPPTLFPPSIGNGECPNKESQSILDEGNPSLSPAEDPTCINCPPIARNKAFIHVCLPLILHLYTCLCLNPSLSVFYVDSSITQNSDDSMDDIGEIPILLEWNHEFQFCWNGIMNYNSVGMEYGYFLTDLCMFYNYWLLVLVQFTIPHSFPKEFSFLFFMC